MTLWLRLIAFACASMFAASPVLAQDDAARERARGEFSRGVQRYEAGDYEAALEAFQEAYRLAPHPSVRVNMANAYEQLDRPLEAIFHFERFLAEAEQVRPEQRREVETALARLRGRVAEVTIQVEPAGATVLIDENDSRSAPLTEPVRMVPGNHTIEVSADGYATMRRDISVEAGDTPTVSITLEGAGAEALGASESGGGATGEGDAGGDLEGGVELTTDTGGGGPSTAPVLIAGGISAALLLGAVVTGISALGANSDFDEAVVACDRGRGDPAACDSGRDAADRASTLALVTDILLVGGLVGAGITAYLIVSHDGGATERAAARLVPVASTTGGGLLLTGGF
jgi:hypothetical protein